MKISNADKWFSKCIRERAGWKCEACHKQYDEGSMGLHCSHFFSRRHRTIRWDGDNAASHCFGCHHKLGGNPLEFAEWIEKHLGSARLEILRDKKNAIKKITKMEEKEIGAHYKKQYQRMQEQREKGVTGYLEFESW